MKILTTLEHREVGVVHWQQVQIWREPGDETDQSIVDSLIRVAVPARQDAPLRRSKEKLRRKRTRIKAKNKQTEYQSQKI